MTLTIEIANITEQEARLFESIAAYWMRQGKRGAIKYGDTVCKPAITVNGRAPIYTYMGNFVQYVKELDKS